MTEEVQQVADALDMVEAIPDREARVLAQSQVMALEAERNESWKEERRKLIFELRAQKVSYRQIAARVGVSLGTVQDILRGAQRWSDRPKKDRAPET